MNLEDVAKALYEGAALPLTGQGLDADLSCQLPHRMVPEPFPLLITT